jgi:phage FluMu protein gp41
MGIFDLQSCQIGLESTTMEVHRGQIASESTTMEVHRGQIGTVGKLMCPLSLRPISRAAQGCEAHNLSG